jgi:hypothetical protein
MIFPTGYEEDYKYREDIIKPNQADDPRRQAKVQHTNHDRSNGIINPLPSLPMNGNHTSQQKLPLTPNIVSNYNSESQYPGLVESQL